MIFVFIYKFHKLNPKMNIFELVIVTADEENRFTAPVEVGLIVTPTTKCIYFGYSSNFKKQNFRYGI